MSTPPAAPWLSHQARLVLTVPTPWRLLPAGLPPLRGTAASAAVASPAGAVITVALIAATEDDARDEVRALVDLHDSSLETTTAGGQLAWLFSPGTNAAPDESVRDGDLVLSDEARALLPAPAPLAALIVAHPAPWPGYNGLVRFVAVLAPAAALPALTASLTFDLTSVAPRRVLDQILDVIAINALHRRAVDWPAVRQAARVSCSISPSARPDEPAADANSGAAGPAAQLFRLTSIEPGIHVALSALRAADDNHSFFVPAQDAQTLAGAWVGLGLELAGDHVMLVYPGSPAATAGLVVGDRLLLLNDEPAPDRDTLRGMLWGDQGAPTFTIRPAAGGPDRRVTLAAGPITADLTPRALALTAAVGYVELFATGGDLEASLVYATAGQAALAAVARDIAPRGWIVDLRRNLGGSFLPMVGAVGPVLGNGPFWGNIDSYGTVTRVSYANQQLWQDGILIADQLITGDGYQPACTDLPVAVLIGPETSSSGEVMALAFRHRPRSRHFGMTTAGYTTSNVPLPLANGATLALQMTEMTDRIGQTYPAGLNPDIEAATDWTRFGTPADPAVAAALVWLDAELAAELPPSSPRPGPGNEPAL